MSTREELYRKFGPMLLEALTMIIMSEVNVLRSWISDFKSEVATATSLADLQSRIASLPDTPDRTVQQLVDAIDTELSGLSKYDWMDS